MDEKEFEEQLSAMHDRVLSMALTEEEQNILLRSTKRQPCRKTQKKKLMNMNYPVTPAT